MIFRNSEHYSDPTAGKAIANVMREEESRPVCFDPIQENLEDLANAIIAQQAEDYRKCRKALNRKTGQRPLPPWVRDEIQDRMREIEAFFRSAWFCTLTTVDGEMILERLKNEEDADDGKGISAAGLSA